MGEKLKQKVITELKLWTGLALNDRNLKCFAIKGNTEADVQSKFSTYRFHEESDTYKSTVSNLLEYILEYKQVWEITHAERVHSVCPICAMRPFRLWELSLVVKIHEWILRISPRIVKTRKKKEICINWYSVNIHIFLVFWHIIYVINQFTRVLAKHHLEFAMFSWKMHEIFAVHSIAYEPVYEKSNFVIRKLYTFFSIFFL